MKKHLKILLAGALVIVPLTATIWLVVWLGSWVDQLGTGLLRTFWKEADIPLGVGVVIIIAMLYLVGILTRLWLFRGLFAAVDHLLSRLPGVKTIYEPVRDLMKLFGGDASTMGKVVLYRQPGTDLMMLGILTNENPVGVAENTPEARVALYQPFSYMFGGPTIYVPAEHVREIDMPVDQALKLAATAHVGARSPQPQVRSPADSAETGQQG
jgi:uncharacterized membrane protein